MKNLENLGYTLCLCCSVISLLLQHSECCHQVARHGGNQLKIHGTPQVGVLVPKTGNLLAPKAACVASKT